MRVKDSKEKTICIVQFFDEIVNERNFLTSNMEEMQFASFKYKKETEIKRHFHNLNKRLINTTSEAIVVLDGSIEVEIYDNNEVFIKKILLNEKDSILMLSGGHKINVLENSKFIEFKQGPYNPEKDKTLF